jgi:hypothetical protein
MLEPQHRYIPHKKNTFDRSFQLLPFGILISKIDLSNRIRSKMTFIDVPHHLPMRANESPTPFLVTGYSLCQTNLHPSTAWGDFIKENSFASASSRSNALSGL